MVPEEEEVKKGMRGKVWDGLPVASVQGRMGWAQSWKVSLRLGRAGLYKQWDDTWVVIKDKN